MKKRKKVGLVLGGGAARGYAHLGVLEVLEKNGIKVDMISGTSMGAVVGAAYALNPNIKEVSENIHRFKLKKHLDFGILRNGIIKGCKIEKFLQDLYKNKKFKDTKIPIYINATDLDTHEELIFTKGDLSKAVRASISIPVIFSPVNTKTRTLIDGGILSNVQADILRKKGADIIITVNLFKRKEYRMIENQKIKSFESNKKRSLIKILLNAVQVLVSYSSMVEEAKNKSDVFIEPNLKKYSMIDFKDKTKIARKGYLATKKQIKKIKKLTGGNVK